MEPETPKQPQTSPQENLKQDVLPAKTDMTNLDTDKLADDFAKNEVKRANKRKLFRALVIVAAVGLVSLVLIALTLILKLDSLVLPVTVRGSILDYAGRPLAGVNVCIQSKCVLTKEDGSYTITGLTYGNYTISAELKNYEKLSEEVSLQRGTNELNRSLQALGMGDVEGSLITLDESTLLTADLGITFDGQPVLLNPDNSFLIKGKTVGSYKLELRSPSYLDIVADVEVEEGLTKLAAIEMQPAFDLRFRVNDWSSGSAIASFSAKIGEKDYSADADGLIFIADQPFQETLSLLIQKQGYNEKQVSLTELQQGLNEAGPYELVPAGKLLYVSDRLGYQNIYAANYDGTAEKLLTDNKGDSVSPYLFPDGSKVAFLSGRDNARDAYGYPLKLPYSVNIDGSSLSRIAEGNYGSYGLGYYDFVSLKRVYLDYVYEGGINTILFNVGPLSGSEGELVFSRSQGYVESLVLTHNGSAFVYSWQGDAVEQNGVYYFDIASRENRKLYSSGERSVRVLSVSADNKLALLSISDGPAGSSDLYQLTLFSPRIGRITNSSALEEYPQLSADNNYVYYLSTRDNRRDIYRINLNGEGELRLTEAGNVSGFMLGNNGMVFYTSDQSLYVMNSYLSGSKARKVTDKVRFDSYTYTTESLY